MGSVRWDDIRQPPVLDDVAVVSVEPWEPHTMP
jgi:hypothetical protein